MKKHKPATIVPLGTCKAIRGENEGEYYLAFRDAKTVTCVPLDPETPTWRGAVHLWKMTFKHIY